MKFDLDSKIEENRNRLIFDYGNLRYIQNAYGYFVVYISFLGLTFFDFIDYLKLIDYCNLSCINTTFIVCIISSLICITYCFYYFIKLFYPQEVAYDKIPFDIYHTMYNKVKLWATKKNKNAENETKEAYLELLEKAVKNNFELYKKKRIILFKSIKFALYSLIPYFIAMLILHLI